MEIIKLYVDAGNSHGTIKDKKPYTIGLFDEYNSFKKSYNLKVGLNSNEAEMIAILYGLLYLMQYKKEVEKHLYSDSQSNVENKRLQHYCELVNVKLIWIDKKQNKIADKLSKFEEAKKISNKTLNNIYNLKNRIENIQLEKEYKTLIKEQIEDTKELIDEKALDFVIKQDKTLLQNIINSENEEKSDLEILKKCYIKSTSALNVKNKDFETLMILKNIEKDSKEYLHFKSIYENKQKELKNLEEEVENLAIENYFNIER